MFIAIITMSGRWRYKLLYILQVLALYDAATAQESIQAESVANSNCFEVGQKSRQMCAEYAQEIPMAETLSVLRHSNFFNSSVCNVIWGGSRIIGGVIAAPKEFPHMASIGYGSERIKTWACGGSLISERFVLTAAHCLNSVGLKGLGKARWVRIGGISLLTKETAGSRQEFAVEQRIYHPEYERPSQYHDIGLLRLDHDVMFNAFARPACLHVDVDIPVDTAVATGWGRTLSGKRSDWLLKVDLSIAPISLCNRTFNDLNPDDLSRQLRDGLQNDTMICAGHPSGGKDTCTGDSGGPLQFILQEPHCMISVIGVTSFGRECGEPDMGAIYTRVSNYIPWIESIVWPKDNADS